MINDIVDTLRRNQFYHPTSRINSFGMPQMGFELTSFGLIAADEIERLREALRLEKEESAACAIDRKETQRERERDEARQEILESLHPDLRKSYAAARGWDCFKEE